MGFQGVDPDQLFEALDISRTGRVSFEDFEVFFNAAVDAVDAKLGDRSAGGLRPPGSGMLRSDYQFKPFGGVFEQQHPPSAAIPSANTGLWNPAFPGPTGQGPRFAG